VMGSDEWWLGEWRGWGGAGVRAGDVRIQRLEVFPPAAVLKPKDTLQVVVRAWYSDGHAEDVTRWARFSSTEDLVAAVDEGGKVRIPGHGESAVTGGYSNLAAATRLAAPLPNPPDPKFCA